MPIKNYTTSVPVVRTVAEVQAMLAKHGASRVAVNYAGGLPVGLSFALDTPYGRRAYDLPVEVAGVARKLAQGVNGKVTPEQAARVAWRIVRDWLDAQLALIEAAAAALDQVMLPYLLVDDGRTVYDEYREREMLAVEPSPSSPA
jgi:hypothetical protein